MPLVVLFFFDTNTRSVLNFYRAGSPFLTKMVLLSFSWFFFASPEQCLSILYCHLVCSVAVQTICRDREGRSGELRERIRTTGRHCWCYWSESSTLLFRWYNFFLLLILRLLLPICQSRFMLYSDNLIYKLQNNCSVSLNSIRCHFLNIFPWVKVESFHHNKII